MKSSISKLRTPSRCREWERQRRNKFNEAVTKLGEVVKAIDKCGNDKKDSENVQYPKIEIIQKAIICLTNFAQEKDQLKGEILALQVQLDAKTKTNDKKDASIQVFIKIKKKHLDANDVKLPRLKKSKHSSLKPKPFKGKGGEPTLDIKLGGAPTPSVYTSCLKKISPKLPNLLPLSNLNVKKGPENTIVMLPATPYIIPQRPLLFPAAPPAFVLVEPNLQTLSNSAKPVATRNNDVTKTTMVNVWPISAYSQSLPTIKSKKSLMRKNFELVKRKSKKTRNPSKSKVKETENNILSALNPEHKISDKNNKNIDNVSDDKNKKTKQDDKSTSSIIKAASIIEGNDIESSLEQDGSSIAALDEKENKKDNNTLKLKETPKNTINIGTKTATILNTVQKTINLINTNKTDTVDKLPVEKEILPEVKLKENKIPNILDSTLCEHAVDVGNARLELAEEFLAASPTAAFLMSFPLVSGNRADSPAEESQNPLQITKDSNNKPNITLQPDSYYEKDCNNAHNIKHVTNKQISSKSQTSTINVDKTSTINVSNSKYLENNITSKQIETKTPNTIVTSNALNENPFFNLPMSTVISTPCTIADTTFVADFDCNINRANIPNQTTYASNSNIFYKGEPLSTVKSTIYSTSNLSSGHEFNSLGLYPCAMEKYTSKNKTDYSNVEENLMKIGSSRLTYDIDLGWSHKSFDFVNCPTTTNSFNKDSILTTTPAAYSSTYNPFNPEFHVPIVSNSNKKEITSKASTSFSEAITSLYSQPANLWSEEVPFYNNNISKTSVSKNLNHHEVNLQHNNTNLKPNINVVSKQFETKQITETVIDNRIKPTNVELVQQPSEKFVKKSNKMHINWMTSEVRSMQSCNPIPKEVQKPSYSHIDHVNKKQDQIEGNYFPISMHNYPTQSTQEDFQVWPSTRPLGTTEVTIEPPPINLPTLVGDLALGPHEKRRNADIVSRGIMPSDVQNGTNFLSVTQLMNRPSENTSSRYQEPSNEPLKFIPPKHNAIHFSNDANRKTNRVDHNVHQPYVYNDLKGACENMEQFSQTKSKTKPDKNSKVHKNNYSAEALLRGGTCTQKVQDNTNSKLMIPPQKYHDFTSQDSSVAQVSHFPPILDYSENTYSAQQYTGTTLYNSTTNTLSNTFYSNFMQGASNLMTGNYTGGPFPGDFMDYNQSTECNYPNHKYEELKIRNNLPMFQQDKTTYKSSRRESGAKHKLECSNKKEPTKKYQNKKSKLNTEVEDWNEAPHLAWQSKVPKRHQNLMSEEMPYSNYVGNQLQPAQYQPEYFNSHIIPAANVQGVGHNADRSIASFPVTSRANFNLSTIFPEITMKVQ